MEKTIITLNYFITILGHPPFEIDLEEEKSYAFRLLSEKCLQSGWGILKKHNSPNCYCDFLYDNQEPKQQRGVFHHIVVRFEVLTQNENKYFDTDFFAYNYKGKNKNNQPILPSQQIPVVGISTYV